MFALRVRDDFINIIINFIKRRILLFNIKINIKFIIITLKIEVNSI